MNRDNRILLAILAVSLALLLVVCVVGGAFVYFVYSGRISSFGQEGGPGVGVEERAEHAEAAAPAPAPSEDSDGIA